jgi:hypothetical protein
VMVSATGRLVPVELVAVSATTVTPDAVGVPVIAPVEATTLRPVGRPVAAKLTGDPVATMA